MTTTHPKNHLLVLLGLATLALAACDASEGPDGPDLDAAGPGLDAAGPGLDAAGPGFAIAVAPLTLPGVTDTCYRLTVTNGPNRTGDIVWQRTNVCADLFGDVVGSIAYIGPCDADVPTLSSVTLELLDLKTGATPTPIADVEYGNPCGEIADWSTLAGRDTLLPGEDFGPCTVNKQCLENADVLVEFNITVMREANQGFFDIGVNFDDVFCSAKLDTCYSDDSPITLLHDGDVRAHTAVAAVACSAGPGATAETYLHFSDFSVTCGTTTYTLNLGHVVHEGSLAAPNPQLATIGGSPTLIASTWFGAEQLPGMNKVFTSLAFVLPAGDPCHVSWTVVPSDSAVAPVPSDGTTGPFSQVAGVYFDAAVNSVTRDVCSRYSLNGNGPGADGGVVATYFGVPVPYTAALEFAGGFTTAAPTPISCAAGPIVDGAPANVTVTLVQGQLHVQTGVSSTTLQLDGYTLTACHQDACCAL